MNERLILLAVFEGVGLLFIGTSVPLLYRKVKPNFWYGVRTAATLSNTRVWYEVNARFGKAMVAYSVLLMALTGILYAIPTLSVDGFASISVTSLLVGLLALTVWVIVLGQKLSRERGKH